MNFGVWRTNLITYCPICEIEWSFNARSHGRYTSRLSGRPISDYIRTTSSGTLGSLRAKDSGFRANSHDAALEYLPVVLATFECAQGLVGADISVTES
ncbi:hypothetical protein An01g06700 [Aspergillus niger]|uniref:Uncharacterized protein n=2 Tax=Aspergillus niger TaxID=5061 RepID=A2Q954_ASPNC|nr:hypothetical protein An01g06700 [Aspergillus niger]CAK43788.1 hypothetical protein An01g06700 [Aspergillus niger]